MRRRRNKSTPLMIMFCGVLLFVLLWSFHQFQRENFINMFSLMENENKRMEKIEMVATTMIKEQDQLKYGKGKYGQGT